MLTVLLSELRSNGHHRCVTPLYRIPLGIFDCVLDGRVKIISPFQGLGCVSLFTQGVAPGYNISSLQGFYC